MDPFDGAIPGQSLTGSPRQFAWERPPETADPEVAIIHHINRLSQPEIEDNVLDAIQFGLPISYLTDLALTGGVAQGIHSIDVSLVIAPVVHEYIRSMAESSGLPYKEFFRQDSDTITPETRKELALEAVREALDKAPEDDPGTNFLRELEETAEDENVQEFSQEKPKKGLMAKEEAS